MRKMPGSVKPRDYQGISEGCERARRLPAQRSGRRRRWSGGSPGRPLEPRRSGGAPVMIRFAVPTPALLTSGGVAVLLAGSALLAGARGGHQHPASAVAAVARQHRGHLRTAASTPTPLTCRSSGTVTPPEGRSTSVVRV